MIIIKTTRKIIQIILGASRRENDICLVTTILKYGRRDAEIQRANIKPLIINNEV
jgi:hypothetical protein